MVNTVRTDMLRQVREAGVRLIRFMYCDTSAIIRGKSTYARGLEDRVRTGLGQDVAMGALSLLDRVAAVPGLATIGEVRIVPDPATLVVLPYVPRVAAMASDLVTVEKQPWGVCSRSFLKRMLARLEAKGMRIRAAFAGEFTLLQREGETFRPLDESLSYATTGMDIAAPTIDAMVEALELQGQHVEQYSAGLGPGHHAIFIQQAEGVQAADNQVFFRETIRGVALQRGYIASFAPRPFSNAAGAGNPLHFSLFSQDGRTSFFYDRSAPQQLSRIGRQFIAGVLEHLPALTALTAASVNSYRRLQPSSWVATFAAWGPDNRQAAIRVASPLPGEEAASFHAALQSCDHTANPYLALGALIAAGMDGIARELPLGDPLLVDPLTLTEAERAARGLRRLPSTLSEALIALSHDSVLGDALGPALRETFLAVKRGEIADFAAHNEDFEFRHHLTAF
jgi:glutamine synthetase